MELEGRVRRAAAERGAVELKKNEFQGELEKQREQLYKIQSSHNFQMESVNKLYQDEKARPALFASAVCPECWFTRCPVLPDGRISGSVYICVNVWGWPLDEALSISSHLPTSPWVGFL